MDESLKCKIFELMTWFVATTNVKGERNRAAILSMSPATAKTRSSRGSRLPLEMCSWDEGTHVSLPVSDRRTVRGVHG
jgi:hypothetical protein